MNFAGKLRKCREYVLALEEERKKIQVFQRELPLCLELVTQAIEAHRKELSGTTTEYIQSDCSDQTSSGTPVLEEFIPIKRAARGGGGKVKNDEDEEDRRVAEVNDRSSNKSCKSEKDHKRKSDWLRSAQLWNQPSDPSPPSQKDEVPRKAMVTEVGRSRIGSGAFQPFQRGKSKNEAVLPSCSAPCSSAETAGSEGGGGGRREEKDGSHQRKQRRCWSAELHRRFLHALQQLGGSHVATPKQIRELMKVDGLTNDEVKSHLQKYRLHTRRPSPTIHGGGTPQTPQFVVVGGIWVPPPEYPGIPSAATPTIEGGTSEIYAPVAMAPVPPALPKAASPPSGQKAEQVSEGGSLSEGDVGHCVSTSTASSTRVAPSSPAY